MAEKLRSLGVCIVVETKNAPMPIVGKLDKRVEDYWKVLKNVVGRKRKGEL